MSNWTRRFGLVLAGQDQQGFEGNFAAVAPAVRALDAHVNPAVGAMVTFVVTQGGGTLASADVVGSDQGEASEPVVRQVGRIGAIDHEHNVNLMLAQLVVDAASVGHAAFGQEDRAVVTDANNTLFVHRY